ncbi:MAG: hypothetical protein LV479_02595 [Methylacidiphilales bacterium]|nr:hypothetical protein [Candidatus Methylacidiphilales bacterium]
MANLGNSWMLPKPGQETEHLWVLITRPDPASREAIMVNVTTQRPHSDNTTVLNRGDHPFIQRPSVVLYADARMVDTRLLDQAVASGSFRAHTPFSGPVLERIQAGLQTSPFTPKKIKDSYAKAVAAGLTG